MQPWKTVTRAAEQLHCKQTTELKKRIFAED